VQQSLVKPDVSGLDDDDAGPPPEEPEGVDYSSPWHNEFVENKENIRSNLHILHPSMQLVLKICQETLGQMLVVDCSPYRYKAIHISM
jgi:dynein heavy chain